MLNDRAAAPFPVPDIGMETWIIRYDGKGACTSPQTRDACIAAVAAQPSRPLFLFSHGWNNDFKDAVDLYRRFLIEYEKVQTSHPLGGLSPIFIGITWPSIWLPTDKGPKMASLPADSFVQATQSVADEIREPADRARALELLNARSVNMDEARELARLLEPILTLNAEAGLAVPSSGEREIVKVFAAVQNASGTTSFDEDDELGVVVDDDRDREPSAAGFQLDPKNALRVASLYVMKNKATKVGEDGIRTLIADLLQKTQASLHLIGHSFGCQVLMSAVSANTDQPRKIESALLLQPAISHLAFADTIPGRDGPGGYRAVLAAVKQPIVCTYSAHDFPLHDLYHHALVRGKDVGEIKIAASRTSAGKPPNNYAALGGYGPRGSGECLVDPIHQPGDPYLFEKGALIVGLDGSVDRRIDGHGGIANPFTAWALRSQLA